MQKIYLSHLLKIILGNFLFQSTPSFSNELSHNSSDLTSAIKNYSSFTETLLTSSNQKLIKNTENKTRLLLTDSWAESTEYFLFYNLELNNYKINMFSYYSHSLIDTYNDLLSITNDSFLFSLDQALLDQLNFSPRNFDDKRFSKDLRSLNYRDLKNKETKIYREYTSNSFKNNNAKTNKVPESELPKILNILKKIKLWLKSVLNKGYAQNNFSQTI